LKSRQAVQRIAFPAAVAEATPRVESADQQPQALGNVGGEPVDERALPDAGLAADSTSRPCPATASRSHEVSWASS